MTDHTITIATRQAPIDTLEPPTMGTLYRWECSCGKAGMSWRASEESARINGVHHVRAATPVGSSSFEQAAFAIASDGVLADSILHKFTAEGGYRNNYLDPEIAVIDAEAFDLTEAERDYLRRIIAERKEV